MSASQPPIFVVGVGRSGSSVFFEVLSRHRAVTWLSMLCDRESPRFGLHRALLKAVDLPLVGTLARRLLTPSEAYRYWDAMSPGFSTPFRDLRADDVSAAARARIQGAVRGMSSGRRTRPILKVTGWPRMGFLSEVFPDARFVHMVRDGRAVANSLLNVPWWWGWRGTSSWRFGELSDEFQELWDRTGRSFVALAAIEWMLLTDAVETARGSISEDRYLQVRYEDLCRDPRGTMEGVASFCGLAWSATFARQVVRSRLRATNDKWRRDLSEQQQQELDCLLGSHLARYGYR